ncbi:hypothetical protein [Trinickia sp.]|uniref:hypothetical protein n=1 Tax=Trinickia sp. TaxID=2571163 RepID=UPI003F7F09E2
MDTRNELVAPKSPTFCRGALYGLIVFIVCAVGIAAPIKVLPFIWTGTWVIALSSYLVRRRHWHALAGMLLVVGIALSVLLGALFVVTILVGAAAGTR